MQADLKADPGNRLYWRMNRRRLDVESWRDALLSVAGNLDPTVGGPSADLDSRATIGGRSTAR